MGKIELIFISPLSYFFTGTAFREHNKAYQKLIIVFEIVLQNTIKNKTFRGVDGEFRGYILLLYHY